MNNKKDKELIEGIQKVALVDSIFEEEIINPLRTKIAQTGITGGKMPSFAVTTNILTKLLEGREFNVNLVITNKKKRRGKKKIEIQL